jgi:hypothetical protein
MDGWKERRKHTQKSSSKIFIALMCFLLQQKKKLLCKKANERERKRARTMVRGEVVGMSGARKKIATHFYTQ